MCSGRPLAALADQSRPARDAEFGSRHSAQAVLRNVFLTAEVPSSEPPFALGFGLGHPALPAAHRFDGRIEQLFFDRRVSLELLGDLIDQLGPRSGAVLTLGESCRASSLGSC